MLRISVFLVAISTQRLGHPLGFGFIQQAGSAEVARALVAHPRREVAGARLAVLGLPLGGQSDTFLRPFMGFLFRHDAPIRSRIRQL